MATNPQTFTELLTLEPHGPDVFVGDGPGYPWGPRVYGGQVVAQGLLAAGRTVDDPFHVHSLHAYFIRGGSADEPIRYEVDRIRNGRSFCTRRVVARQSGGAILNLSTSFHVDEPTQGALPSVVPHDADVGVPEHLTPDAWSPLFDRRNPKVEGHVGRYAAWLRMNEDLGDDRLLQACALAYLSDDIPTGAVWALHPDTVSTGSDSDWDGWMSASLDHGIWFHLPARADRWMLHDFTSETVGGGRGLAIGKLRTPDGLLAATVTQEVLLRRH